jgi:hypothetical protein
MTGKDRDRSVVFRPPIKLPAHNLPNFLVALIYPGIEKLPQRVNVPLKVEPTR